MKLNNKFLLSVLLAIFCAGCATVINPATKKQEFIFINTQTEANIGKNMAREVATKYKFSDEPAQIERVETTGRRIAAVSDRQDLKYSFYVIKDKRVNAFTAPGGYIYVNTGLLDNVSSDDELAGVLAHEIGHVAALHSVKKMQAILGYNILVSIALGDEDLKDVRRGIDAGVELIILGYSREDELLADRLAVRYVSKAGYDPNAMVTFLEKLGEKEKSNPTTYLTFLRSHPPVKRRIEAVKAEIANLNN